MPLLGPCQPSRCLASPEQRDRGKPRSPEGQLAGGVPGGQGGTGNSCRPTIDRELLESLPNLKVIANSGVGVDHLDLKMISSFVVKVTNTPHTVADPTADIGIALMLASAGIQVEGNVLNFLYPRYFFGIPHFCCDRDDLSESIYGMLLHGKFSEALTFIGIYFSYGQEEQADSATYCKKIDSLLQQADFVMLVVSLTPQTHKLIRKRELELMKPTATLINISRGTVQIHWLASQPGLAAFHSTVLHPAQLRHMNIVITPHLGIKTDKATYMITEEGVENILAALNGLPLPSEVLPS
uniref:D-isomer specific 2-hydroxyacid dehydrogenase NAD-binding domain-containing protein n=1 Tax=Taeniopygia guttata TaxID=59729 RepID=A0A674GWQ9_TAEGU